MKNQFLIFIQPNSNNIKAWDLCLKNQFKMTTLKRLLKKENKKNIINNFNR